MGTPVHRESAEYARFWSMVLGQLVPVSRVDRKLTKRDRGSSYLVPVSVAQTSIEYTVTGYELILNEATKVSYLTSRSTVNCRRIRRIGRYLLGLGSGHMGLECTAE